ARERDAAHRSRARARAGDDRSVRRGHDAHPDHSADHYPRLGRDFRPGNALLGDDLTGARETDSAPAFALSPDRSGTARLRQSDLPRHPWRPDGPGAGVGVTAGYI